MQLQALILAAFVASTAFAASDASNDALSGVKRMHRHHGMSLECRKDTSNKNSTRLASDSNSGDCMNFRTVKRAKSVKSSTSQSHAGSKLGIATADYGIDFSKFTSSKKVSWMYDWQATPNGQTPSKGLKKIPDGVCYFPMLWGTKNVKAGNGAQRYSDFKKYIVNNPNSPLLKKCPDGSPRKIMMFNEVDLATQGGMTVSEACAIGRQYFLPLKQNHGVEIIGPSSILGNSWYKRFRSQCPDVFKAIDYDSVHDYQTDPQTTIWTFEAWHAEFGKPLAITEYGAYDYNHGGGAPSKAKAQKYVQGVMEWAESTDYVKFVAPYAVLTHTNIGKVNALATSSGQPTKLWNIVLNAVKSS
ncbi:glycoside hydrolase family 128 protein [Tilletiaria anomala UBC 951]|uniref:Glycoside hydrolase family 128 protein n=1 Tax=Tilletiaria anomala (strain ATCC 24038 / CBS 436.72 / UBC 951) TaxID=1037660 RepID=A0A066VZ29_TILAU|nr:glycoside hydrolase family 128 protein [Tilletiaria anomala UBC 951]KDN43780.1 glycoside hydrolase family 128 protein [Tilletiaria anomala UBC 951]